MTPERLRPIYRAVYMTVVIRLQAPKSAAADAVLRFAALAMHTIKAWLPDEEPVQDHRFVKIRQERITLLAEECPLQVMLSINLDMYYQLGSRVDSLMRSIGERGIDTNDEAKRVSFNYFSDLILDRLKLEMEPEGYRLSKWKVTFWNKRRR